jgi:hypothetical protein
MNDNLKADIFIRNLGDIDQDKFKDTDVNKRRWLKIKSGMINRGDFGVPVTDSKGNLSFIEERNIRWFIIHKFSEDETKTIKRAILNYPQNFIFNRFGNLKISVKDWSAKDQYTNVVFDNPTTSISSLEGNLLSERKYQNSNKYGDVFTYDENIVMSEGLKYILYFDEDSKTYCILYNPIHRRTFLKYYNSLNKENLRRGLTDVTRPEINQINLKDTLNLACNATLVGNGEDSSFADPTCNLLTPINCKFSSFLNKNMVNFPAADSEVIQRAMEALGDRCLCAGGIINFVNNAGLDKSYINSFLKNTQSYCPENLEINTEVCQVILNSGGDINVKSSQIRNQCSIKGMDTKDKPDETPSTPDETPSTPDETPSTPDETPSTPDEIPIKPDKIPLTPDKQDEDNTLTIVIISVIVFLVIVLGGYWYLTR